MNKLRKELEDYRILLTSVPSMVVSVFILSVVCMNLMAGRELYRSDHFCINSGLALSWISFLCMDCICKRFGASASVKISILAIFVNAVTAIIFKVLCMTPGHWAAYYSAEDIGTAQLINSGVDMTFSSAWYVVLGSSIAMFLSSIVNGVLNRKIGNAADKGGYSGFAVRSLVSTCIAQWIDNFVFSALVSHVFFGWTWTQVIICSTTSMVIELVMEAVFSPLGFRVSSVWEKNKVGQKYVDHHEKTMLQAV